MMKKEIKEKITIMCIFCSSTQFVLPDKEFIPYHGVFLVCANCGRENDYTSLFLIAKGKAFEMAKKIGEKMVNDELKKAFKKFKF